LLAKRYTTNGLVPRVAVNAADALSKVLQERRKELLLRGLRWTDLRRLNRDPAHATTISHAAGGLTYVLAPASVYTFPIPDDIIQLSGIAQNPG
ncbi:MAG TPA: RagB/SusD family nutrient uptake outer membrane protein, partial [Chitinophagaceae bacterium]|nr:RagB/SusD family nutrient uptake outer membrane protein [Chitinophagaceae bacterium]